MSNSSNSSRATLAVRVAVLRALADEIRDHTAATRAEAEKVFGEARRDHGIKTLSVVLPTGAEVGTISIKAGGSVIRWHGAALVDYVEATAPTEIVETVDPAVLADPELVLWVLQHRPHMVRREVRPAYRTRLARELTDDGELVDPTTGEVHKVAEIERTPPDGSFAYRPAPSARADVLAAWQSGALDALGILPPTSAALDSGDDGEAE